MNLKAVERFGWKPSCCLAACSVHRFTSLRFDLYPAFEHARLFIGDLSSGAHLAIPRPQNHLDRFHLRSFLPYLLPTNSD